MILSGINFPNKLLEAIQDNTLVVFAGAGASMDPPTSLPGFEKLVDKIAEGTGQTRDEKEPCEVFLGHLKSKGIDVNQLAANLLSGQCLQHNEMHQAIIDLFHDPVNTKVVTTNYDQMLEQVIDEKNQKVPVFNAPALPLGDDVSGIIHIHGNIDNPKYMVVTDEDFGKAYLTEGYAARFLIKLFQSYSILFIGYSYNDTILRYLTRAMARNVGASKYILTDEPDSDWEALGITPIFFPKRDFVSLKEGIIKLGQRTKRGLIEWKKQFEEISDQAPLSPDLNTEIDYCLADFEKTRIFADSIKGLVWLNILDEKGVFNPLFSTIGELSEFDKVWLEWLLKQIVGEYDVAFENLILKNRNQIHTYLAKAVLRKLVVDSSEISDEYLQKYIILFDSHIDSPWIIFRLIEVCAQRRLFSICRGLFAKYFEIYFVPEKDFWHKDEECIYKHHFKGKHYYIQHSWELCRENFLQDYSDYWLHFIKAKICDLHEKYLLFGQDIKGGDPYEMAMLVIEDRDDPSRDNELNILCDIYVEDCKAIENRKPVWIREFLVSCLEEPSGLLKKLALKALRELKSISANEKFDIFIKHTDLDFWGGKEQIFLLIKRIFNDLTEDRKNQLIDLIEAQGTKLDDRANEYRKYNWCVWIRQFCQDNDRINQLQGSILSKNNFAPREHPELDIEFSSAVWVLDKSPVDTHELVHLEQQELLSYLRDYNEDPFDGPSRNGMLRTFAECCKLNYIWALEVAQSLVDEEIQREDVWDYLIRGIQDGNAGIEERVNLLKLMTSHLPTCGNVRDMVGFLWNTLERDPMKEEFGKYEYELLGIADVLWNNRGECDIRIEKLVDATLNTTLGNILLSYIYMLSYCGEQGIPDRYKIVFENNLKLEGYEKKLALCVIAGYFNFLCLRDHDWCTEQFSAILEGSDKDSFSAAWEGTVFFSNRLNKDVADVVAIIYLKALEHIDWLSGETRRHFIDLYLVLLIYAVEEPCQKYIPEFYKYAVDEDRKEFLSSIEHRLRNADSKFKVDWWNRWLHQFVINRFQNKPVALTDSEYMIIMNWIPELPEVFGELVQFLCDHNMPQQVDTMFLYRLNENKLVVKYPHDVIKLLTALLYGGTDFQYYTDELPEIFGGAENLSEHEMREFQEACLKRNIRLDRV